MDWTTLFSELTKGVLALVDEPGRILMMVVGGVLIYLAVVKDYEPALLLPIGLGCILANLYGTGMGILSIKTVPWVSFPDADPEGLGIAHEHGYPYQGYCHYYEREMVFHGENLGVLLYIAL